MAILNELFGPNGRFKKAGSPLMEEDLYEEANHAPDIPQVTAGDQDNEQPAEVVRSDAGAENPFGYSREVMDYLSENGVTADVLERIRDFDPVSAKSIIRHSEDVFRKSNPAPTAPDEKKIRNAHIVGGIGDAIEMLAQMFAAGKGAHVKERGFNESALSEVEGKEKELRGRYEELYRKYSDGLQRALENDLKGSRDYYDGVKKEIRDLLDKKKKEDKADRDYEFKREQFEKEQANAERKLDALEKQVQARVIREGRLASGSKPGSSGKGNRYEMIIDAHPNDDLAIADRQFGGRVRVFEMTKGEIDRWSRKAKADRDFMSSKHVEPAIKRIDPYGGVEYNQTDLAEAYVRYLYELRFRDPLPVVSSFERFGEDSESDESTDWRRWIEERTEPGSILSEDEEADDVLDEEDDEEEFEVLGRVPMANF